MTKLSEGVSEVPVMLRTSERRSFTACRQQWHWSFNDRLKAIQTKPALRFGGLVHEALAIYYPPGRKRGPKPWLSFEKLYKQQIEDGMRDFRIRLDEDEEWAQALDLGIAMLRNYVDRWGDDSHIKVIAPEMTFQVPVLDNKGRVMVIYVGTCDLAFIDMNLNQTGIMETKTAAAISTRHLPMDEQAGSYWVFAPQILQAKKKLKPGQDIDFIQYNFLRKTHGDTRPQNAQGQYLNKPSKDTLVSVAVEKLGLTEKEAKSRTVETLSTLLRTEARIDPEQLGEPSKNQPPPSFVRERVYRDTVDRENIMYRIRAQAWEMAKVRAGTMPVYKNPSGTWPDQHCNGCEFNEICALHETGSDWEELARLTMTTWDPYEDHRESKEDL